MSVHQKYDVHQCGNCIHFRRHYINQGFRYAPLDYGHCVYPRSKLRDAGQTCPGWSPRPQVR